MDKMSKMQEFGFGLCVVGIFTMIVGMFYLSFKQGELEKSKIRPVIELLKLDDEHDYFLLNANNLDSVNMIHATGCRRCNRNLDKKNK